MTLDVRLKEIDFSKEIDEKQFYQLILMFRDDFFVTKDFESKLSKHRKPLEYLNQVLHSSFDRLREIGNRKEMNDTLVVEGKVHIGNVYTRVKLIHEENKSLNIYQSIKEYCKQTNKDFNAIALLIAEYRGIEKVRGKIRMKTRRYEKNIKVNSNIEMGHTMAKANIFDTSNVLDIRSRIMNGLPSNFISPLAAQQEISKIMSYDFILKAVQEHQKLYSGLGAIANLLKNNPGISKTISSSFYFQKMFDFKPVVAPDINNYLKLFNDLKTLNPDNYKIIDSDTDSEDQLLEVEYDLTELDGATDDKEQERRIILLNESNNIKKTILDIYGKNNQLFNIKPRQFEELMAELLTNRGFQVELTKQTRDGGYDIIALYKVADLGTMKWLVECKRFTREKVGIEVIRSFKEVIQSNNVNRGIIATTSYFTADAIKKKQETPYLLDFLDKDAILKWIFEYVNGY